MTRPSADTVAPRRVGPAAPRVKGGVDLVGDDYNADPASATYQPVPISGPEPARLQRPRLARRRLAAGWGVLANGSTYNGPYNASTVSGNTWRSLPGVAPKADLYGIRVFGCAGSTDVTVDAIEWAVANDMDVINMSLGSPFGSKDDPSAVASTNAAKAGVIVVTSAGNSGPSQYITGSPGTADGAIATAANDTWQASRACASLRPAARVDAINANGYHYAAAVRRAAGQSPRPRDDPVPRLGDESLGCSARRVQRAAPARSPWPAAASVPASPRRSSASRPAPRR